MVVLLLGLVIIMALMIATLLCTQKIVLSGLVIQVEMQISSLTKQLGLVIILAQLI